MRFLLCLCFILFFSPTLFAHAQQMTANSIIGASASITLDPAFPNPGEPVTATLDDYSINASGATITWYFDGHELPGMRSKRSITVSADKNGLDQKISVALSFTNHPTLRAEAVVHPIYLDVIVEPQTYTPIFYAGRALPVYGSTVNVTALLQLQSGMINPTNYTYSWEFNNKVLYGGPQRGSNRAQLTIPYGLSSTLILSVADSKGTIVGRRLITIPSVPVDLEFYEESALYGLGQRALGTTVRVIGNSTTIRAVPYYVSSDAIGANKLTSAWTINGKKNTTALDDPFTITLQPDHNGSAKVGFSFRNLSALIQGAEKAFTVTF